MTHTNTENWKDNMSDGLTMEQLLGTEAAKPIYHRTISAGIRQLKKDLRKQGTKSSMVNMIVRAYKRRFWMDFDAKNRNRGSFPSHQVYGKKMKITTSGLGVEYEIEVKSGQK